MVVGVLVVRGEDEVQGSDEGVVVVVQERVRAWWLWRGGWRARMWCAVHMCRVRASERVYLHTHTHTHDYNDYN